MDFRKIVVFLVFLFVISCPVNGQNLSDVEREKLNEAEKTADAFVERFRQTLDFATVWKEFRASDSLCVYKEAVENFNEVSSKNIKVSDDFLETLFVETMNFVHLKAAYELSVKRMDGNSTDKDITPKEILTFQKKLKYLGDKNREPKNVRQLSRLIKEARLMSLLYRKYMPSDVMRSPQWKAITDGSINWDVRADSYISDGGEGTFCTKKGDKVYAVNRHLFYFFMIEENKKMKVQGIGIGD